MMTVALTKGVNQASELTEVPARNLLVCVFDRDRVRALNRRSVGHRVCAVTIVGDVYWFSQTYKQQLDYSHSKHSGYNQYCTTYNHTILGIFCTQMTYLNTVSHNAMFLTFRAKKIKIKIK